MNFDDLKGKKFVHNVILCYSKRDSDVMHTWVLVYIKLPEIFMPADIFEIGG